MKSRKALVCLLVLLCCLMMTVCSAMADIIEVATNGESSCVGSHVWSNATCGNCGATCNHVGSWENGTCSECKTVCSHNWSNGVCTGECGMACPSHDLSSGSCSNCGMACPHPSGSGTQKMTNVTYKDIGDKYVHEYSYNYLPMDMICDVCSQVMQTIEDSALYTAKENHTFENGTCTKCEAVCSHSWDDGVCSVCYMPCPHSWSNGVCSVCSLTCQHGMYDSSHMCIDCGLPCEHDYDESGVCTECFKICYHENQNEDHVCLECGLGCQHPSSSGNSERANATYTDLGDGWNHECTYNLITKMYCDVCSELAFIIDDDKTLYTVYEIHNFVDGECTGCGTACTHIDYTDDVCNGCGYVCKHEDLRSPTLTRSKEVDWKKKDDQVHYYTYDLISYQRCRECGTEVNLEIIQANVTEEKAHDFRDGVCDDCGAVNSCAHTGETYTVSRKQHAGTGYTSVDAQTHQYAYNLFVETYCAACGEMVNQEYTDNAGVMLESHCFDEYSNSYCLDCGYQKPETEACAHANIVGGERVTDVYSSFGDIDPDTITYTELRHTYQANILEYQRCADCGAMVGEKVVGTQTITENHYMDDDTCVVCGMWRATCAHTYVDDYTYVYRGSYEAVDANTHMVYGQLRNVKNCLACGMAVGDRTVVDANYRTEEAHIWEVLSGNVIRCAECGYQKTCAHSKTEKGDYYETIGNATAVDGNSHTILANRWDTVVCSDCGTELSCTFAESSVTMTEEHDFMNGVCLVCEYVKPDETPTPAPTPTPTPKPSSSSSGSTGTGTTTTQEEDLMFEPTPAPTAAPEMIEKLMSDMAEAEAGGSEVTVEVVGAQEVMTEEEYTELKRLTVQEQILVTLASIGFEDVVTAAMETMDNVALSEEAQMLMSSVSERMSNATPEEKEALEQKLAQYFPVREIEVDGETYPYFIMELEIEVDGVTTVQRYGFRMDENGEWIFVMLKTDTL